MTSISLIDFSVAKYQVPEGPSPANVPGGVPGAEAGPGPADLSQYETQIVIAEEGTDLIGIVSITNLSVLFTIDEDNVRDALVAETKNSVYVNALNGVADFYLSPENRTDSRIYIESGSENDSIFFGRYEYLYVTSGAGDDEIDTGGGIGYIDSGEGNDLVYPERSLFIFLRLGDGNDLTYEARSAWGEAGNDTMIGSSFEDLLMGGDGNDRLKGRRRNDTLNGGGGDDKILAGWGDDYVKGGLGNDIIKLGKGSDILDLSRGNDRIRDFQVDKDTVIVDESEYGQKFDFIDTEKGAYITNGDDVNTFFKGVSSDLLETVVLLG